MITHQSSLICLLKVDSNTLFSPFFNSKILAQLSLGMKLKVLVMLVLWIHLIENFGLYIFLFLNLILTPNYGGKVLTPYLEELEKHVNLGENLNLIPMILRFNYETFSDSH